MAIRFSEKQKEEIIQKFTDGFNLDELSEQYNCTKLTITRNLKKYLGDEQYKTLLNTKKNKKQNLINKEKLEKSRNTKKNNEQVQDFDFIYTNQDLGPIPSTQFIEIAPLEQEIDLSIQKDISSISISEISFPKIVFMIVSHQVELDIKLLKDYPEWGFLPRNDLDRKTIEIYFDLKIAKRFCKNDQKVIKVPNPEVFRITAPILLSKGISRIIATDKLIAL